MNIFSSNPDETIFLVEKFADQLQISIMDGTLKWSGVTSGHFEKWMTAKTPIYLRKSGEHQSIAFFGLKEAGDHYESLADGMIRLQSDPLFWVGELFFSQS